MKPAYLNGGEEAVKYGDGQTEGLWIKLQAPVHINEPLHGLVTLGRGDICILQSRIIML